MKILNEILIKRKILLYINSTYFFAKMKNFKYFYLLYKNQLNIYNVLIREGDKISINSLCEKIEFFLLRKPFRKFRNFMNMSVDETGNIIFSLNTNESFRAVLCHLKDIKG